MPLAPSYDTVGWFARDARTFATVGRVLLDPWRDAARPTRLLIADDLFERAEPAVRAALAPAVEGLTASFGEIAHIRVTQDHAADWREVFRVLQSHEAWRCHGEWILRTRPSFGPGVKERFEAAERLSPTEVGAAQAARRDIRARMDELVPPGTVVVLPTAPDIAPRAGAPEAELAGFRARAIEMLSPAGHAGMPQISIPAARVDGCPVGLSLLAARGEDERLLNLAVTLAFLAA